MPLPFGSWSLEQVRSALDAALAPNTEKNRMFIEGDHWQDSEGWSGPRPDESDLEHSRVMELIQKGFCSENAIKEVCERHAAGAMGHEPVWGFTPIRGLKTGEKPTDAEQKLIDELEAHVTEWWNEKGAHGVLRVALEKALWAAHGPVRCFIPSGRLETWTVDGRDDDGGKIKVSRSGLKITRGDMKQALRNIFIESPEPENSVVVKEESTQATVGITRYEVLTNPGDPESDTEEFFELTWVDDQTDETVFRIMGEDGQDNIFRMGLGGHRTTHMIERPALITDPVIQNQKALNTAITLSLTNLGDATFLERTFLNARMPGHEEEYTDPVTQTKRKRWVRDDYVTGPGAVNFVKGEEIELVDGTTTLATPQLIHKPPMSLQPILDTADFYYVLILREVRQTHILKNEEGRASGKSHEQARVDYNISLNVSKEPGENVGRDTLSAAVAWAELLAGIPGKYSSVLRPFFECQLDLGPVSQDERSQNREDVEAGIMDDETAMARAGILDVDKTKAIIASRPEARLKQLERLAGIVQKSGGKVKMSVMATLAKFDPKEIALLEKAEKEEQERQDKMAKEKADAEAKRPVVGAPASGAKVGGVRRLPVPASAA